MSSTPDARISSWCRQRWGSGADRYAKAVAKVGSGAVIWGAAEVVRRAATGDSADGWLAFAIPVGAAYGTSILLSRVIGRPRPCQDGISALVKCPSGPALPSDQAAAAFAAAHVISARTPSARFPAFALATLLGGARVYVGVHHASDVLVGSAFGYLCARLQRPVQSFITRHAGLAASADG